MTKKRLWKFVLITLAVFVAAIAGVHFYYKRSLEQYRAELVARGEKLTVKELQPLPCEDEEEAEEVWTAYEQLPPLPDNIATLMKAAGKGKARVAWKQEAIIEKDFKDEEEDVWPKLEVAFASMDSKDLERLLQALKAECFSTGSEYQWAQRLPRLAKMKRMSQYLQQAVLWHLKHGRVKEAVDCAEGGVRILAGSGGEVSTISLLVRLACAYLAMASTWEVLQHPNLGIVGLESLQRVWDRLDWRKEFPLMLRMELAMTLENAFNAADGPEGFSSADQAGATDLLLEAGSEVFKNPVKSLGYAYHASKLAGAGPYWRIAGRNREQEMLMRSYVDIIGQLERLPSSKSLRNIQAEKKYPPLIGFLGSEDMYLDKVIKRVTVAETQREMVIAAIALARFKLSQGSYPVKLAELRPDYCPRVLIDWFVAEPLRYRNNSNGTYLLYSVGPDLADDNGEADEKLFLSWSRLDWVWPQPL